MLWPCERSDSVRAWSERARQIVRGPRGVNSGGGHVRVAAPGGGARERAATLLNRARKSMRHIVRCRSGGGRGREARERHGVTREGEPGTREPRGRRARASRVCASPQCRRRVKHKPPTLQRPQGEGGGTRRQAGTALSRWAQSRRTCPRVSVRVAEKLGPCTNFVEFISKSAGAERLRKF